MDSISNMVQALLDKRYNDAMSERDRIMAPGGWREPLGNMLSTGMNVMGPYARTMGVGAPKVQAFNPNTVPPPEAGHIPLNALIRRAMTPANSSNRTLSPLPMDRQLEFQRLVHQKYGILDNYDYESPYGTALYNQNQNRMQELRDLLGKYKKADQLGWWSPQ